VHRNPFRIATEGELAELVVFMLGRRMTSFDPAPGAIIPGVGT
jgi:hypothetical protein